MLIKYHSYKCFNVMCGSFSMLYISMICGVRIMQEQFSSAPLHMVYGTNAWAKWAKSNNSRRVCDCHMFSSQLWEISYNSKANPCHFMTKDMHVHIIHIKYNMYFRLQDFHKSANSCITIMSSAFSDVFAFENHDYLSQGNKDKCLSLAYHRMRD